jgi:hypothetical protein
MMVQGPPDRQARGKSMCSRIMAAIAACAGLACGACGGDGGPAPRQSAPAPRGAAQPAAHVGERAMLARNLNAIAPGCSG